MHYLCSLRFSARIQVNLMVYGWPEGGKVYLNRDAESMTLENKGERPPSYLFIKTFQKEDGSKYVHFESVTVSQEGMEVSISSHIIRENQLRNKMKSDRLLYKATALDESANSSAGQPINQGGSLSSDGKVITLSADKQV